HPRSDQTLLGPGQAGSALKPPSLLFMRWRFLLGWFRWGRWAQEGGGDGAGDPGRPQDGDRGLGWWGDSGGGQEVSVQVEQLSPVKGPGAVAHAEPPGAPQMPGVQAPAGGEEVFQATWFADRVADPQVPGTGGFTGEAAAYRTGTAAVGGAVQRHVRPEVGQSGQAAGRCDHGGGVGVHGQKDHAVAPVLIDGVQTHVDLVEGADREA